MNPTRLLRASGVCLLVLAAIAPAKLNAAEPPIEGFKDTPILPGTKWHLHDPDRPERASASGRRGAV